MADAAGSEPIEVVSVNVAGAKGVSKKPVAEIEVFELGVRGDAHAGPGPRQVSLLAWESVTRFARLAERSFQPGEFAENITFQGLSAPVGLLDRLRIGTVELLVTQLGKTCHGQRCAIFQEVGRCIMPQEGLFARVLHWGIIRPGDRMEYLPRVQRVSLITLSDRAFCGAYPDRSGPRLRELVEGFFRERNVRIELETRLLPDEPERLRQEIQAALCAGVDLLITTGGTGVGPRDCAPDVVAGLCDKLIPGIMEAIRVQHGATNPGALLSRAVAGVAGTALLYTLPGSVRAVEEYWTEIQKSLEHLVYMIHGVEAHGR